MHCVNELRYILIFQFSHFLIFIHFTKQITWKPSLAQMLKLILFKFSTMKGQINVPPWTHMGHKGWRKDEKTSSRCYTIAIKFWDEFIANFALLYFSSYSSIKMWHLYLKNVEKKWSSLGLHISGWSSLVFSKTFSILRNILPWYSNTFTCIYMHLLSVYSKLS